MRALPRGPRRAVRRTGRRRGVPVSDGAEGGGVEPLSSWSRRVTAMSQPVGRAPGTASVVASRRRRGRARRTSPCRCGPGPARRGGRGRRAGRRRCCAPRRRRPPGAPVGVEAPEDADRVEAVAERPRVRGHQDPAGAGSGAQVDAVVGEERLDVGAQRPRRVAEVVAGLEAGEQRRGRAGRRGRRARRSSGARSVRVNGRTTRVADRRLEAARCRTGGGRLGGATQGRPSRVAAARPGARAVLVEAPAVVGAGEGDPVGVDLRQPAAGRRRTRGCRAGARTPSGRSRWPGRRGARRRG